MISGEFKPITNEELQTALNEWRSENREEAIQKYGHISTWNMSLITDIYNLFVWQKKVINNKRHEIMNTVKTKSSLRRVHCIFAMCASIQEFIDNTDNMQDLQEKLDEFRSYYSTVFLCTCGQKHIRQFDIEKQEWILSCSDSKYRWLSDHYKCRNQQLNQMFNKFYTCLGKYS